MEFMAKGTSFLFVCLETYPEGHHGYSFNKTKKEMKESGRKKYKQPEFLKFLQQICFC